MASQEGISGSDESETDIKTPEPEEAKLEQSPPQSVLSYRIRESPQKTSDRATQQRARSAADDSIAVLVAAPKKPWEYEPYRGDITVDSVLGEIRGKGDEQWFRIEYEDGRQENVSLSKLLELRNGQNAMDIYENDEEEEPQDMDRSSTEPRRFSRRTKRARTKAQKLDFVDSAITPFNSDEDDDELSATQTVLKKRRLERGHVSVTAQNSRSSSRFNTQRASRTIHDDDSEDSGEVDDSDEEPLVPLRRSGRPTRGGLSNTYPSNRSTRFSKTTKPPLKVVNRKSNDDDDDDSNEDEDELAGDDVQEESDGSDIGFRGPSAKKKRAPGGRRGRGRSQSALRRGRSSKVVTESDSDSPGRRRSSRAKAVKNMREHDMDEEIYADEVASSNTPKVISIREIYQPIAPDQPFSRFHNNNCDVCDGVGNRSNKGISPLVYCQGCSVSIHKLCLGYRSGREHMVTKVGTGNFVMQCRRCIGTASKKDPSAPRLDICQTCKEPGPACSAFSPRKTAKQEEKLREENDGQDPITEVSSELLNNAGNVLFRCTACHLGYHFEHLPPPRKSKTPNDLNELREARLKQYSLNWQCAECRNVPAKVQTLVAWRPADHNSYIEGQTAEDFREDEREYLVKWEEKSFFQCSWRPGGWVWGVTAAVMRNAFFRRDEGANLQPKWTNEDAIPEEYLRMEIIFEVSYANGFKSKSAKADKAAIHMVNEVFVKFQGLGYEDSVWEEPPEPKDEGRWSDFVAAYNEYIAGKYFKQIPASVMKESLKDFRASSFEEDVEMEKQPSSLTGGQIMPYQLEGMNWLLYNFHRKKNVILADEMGLGKTIQIVALLAALITHNPKCWPFLIVTPNSTCPNWRREIKKWAPDLRVVAYYGTEKARNMAMDYELYPDGSVDLRAHVVVTSYEGPVHDKSKGFFRKIKWAGMIVDEGQRLKNDENLLYAALKALKTPFQVLLTGTPLQNNKRELFNLLQFLDPSINAAKLDEEYAELTKDNLPQLHDLIRPFFLRRTKIQVLKFLPPMAQVILPVTMSVVQKKLYKSILARNPQLIKSIFGQSTAALGPKERGNLNNILMQLRKCLCHPFIYSSAIEERSVNEVALHRNLVDASSKFQLLEIMLPKLQERGHRVLMFSQFLDELDLIEDFLNGLGLQFERLDGTIGALEKQRRIDAFNAPESPLFAFLLSTRSGGVGINLATADTVIIMDPDFNPHQDIQALSRAHRIGQKKKVLCFQLMTKDSAEEKIVQIGRKKMALDQALIESMGAEDDAGVDLESILKFGAEALFNDDDRNDIRYDSASVDKLLDRAQVEATSINEEKTVESQFSFARVWANDKATLTDDVGDADVEASIPDFSVWEKILKQREADAAREAAMNAQTFGRGKRARNTINYEKSMDEEMLDSSPVKPLKSKDGSASDLDFAGAVESDGDIDEDSEFGGVDNDIRELRSSQDTPTRALASSQQKGTKKSSTLAPFWKNPPREKTRIGRKVATQAPSKLQKQQGPAKRLAPAVRQSNGAGLNQAMSSQPSKVAGRKPNPKLNASETTGHNRRTSPTHKKRKSLQEPANCHEAEDPTTSKTITTPTTKPPDATGKKSTIVATQTDGKPGGSPVATMKSHKKKSFSLKNAQISDGEEAAGKAPTEPITPSTHASNIHLISVSSQSLANQNTHKQSSKHIDHQAQANKLLSPTNHQSFPHKLLPQTNRQSFPHKLLQQTDHQSSPNKKHNLALISSAPNILLKSSSTKIQPSSEDKMDLEDPPLKSGIVQVGGVEFIQFSLQDEMDILKGNIQHNTSPRRQRQSPRLRSGNTARPVKVSISSANVP